MLQNLQCKFLEAPLFTLLSAGSQSNSQLQVPIGLCHTKRYCIQYKFPVETHNLKEVAIEKQARSMNIKIRDGPVRNSNRLSCKLLH